MHERITLHGDSHEIETRPVTMIVNTSHGEIEYEDREVFDAEASLAHYRSLGEIDEVTASLVPVVLNDLDIKGRVTKAYLDTCPKPYQQVAGLISLSVEAVIGGRKFVWRRPESGLHPRHQVGLADLMLLFSDGRRMVEFLNHNGGE
jgi:hypothetical protein